MYCKHCGSALDHDGSFCPGCGRQRRSPEGATGAQSHPGTGNQGRGAADYTVDATMLRQPPTGAYGEVDSNGKSFSFSTIGIICGIAAFLFFPIVLGPLGLVFGAIAKTRDEKNAIIAMTLGGVGLVVGMFLGALMASSSY